MTTALEPAWLRAARAKLGTREVAGPANSPTIMAWARKLGAKVLGTIYNADSVPWCGLFVATCVAEVGLPTVPIALRASSWSAWGFPLAANKLSPGAVLVFQREGGGHVGFYIGEDIAAYHVLGGNQSDAVTITRIAKDRCVARRWPVGQPLGSGPVAMKAIAGLPLSRNEA